MSKTSDENKAIVKGFIHELLHGAGPDAAFDKYCDPSYKQHNPRLVNGKAGFLEFGRNVSHCAGFTFEVIRMSAEDDLVWLQSVTTGFHWAEEPNPADPNSLRHVFMDIFRVTGGKIVEHWDVYQQIPTYTANGNDMV